MSDITVRELVRDTKAVLDRVEAGETIRIKGRTVVLTAMGQAVTPDITKPVVEKVKRVEEPLEIEGSEEVDDWGLPVTASNTDMARATGTFQASGEWNPDPPTGQSPVPSKPKPSAPPATASNPEPLKPWKSSIGLSKSQQAGGKYER